MLPKRPDKIAGINIDGAMERYEKMMEEGKEKNANETQESKVAVPNNINKSEYLIIPDSSFIIAEYEPEWTKGEDYEGSHRKVLEKGLQVPRIDLFMRHFNNVIASYNGSSELYDASRNRVVGNRLDSLYKYLTSGHNEGAWSWLNAKFVDGTGYNNMDLEVVVGIDNNGELVKDKKPLLEYLSEDCFVDFSSLNEQGLALSKFQSQDYNQGENIHFYEPRKDSVARFDAGSGWAYLDCNWNHNCEDSSLGVFASTSA